MGYTTQFKGELRLDCATSVPMIAALTSMFGEDCREHPEWGKEAKDLSYIDLELNEEFTAIRWDGSEKTYDMEKLVNLLIREMCKKFPEFRLSGVLTAQGESVDDRWHLYIGDDGFAYRQEIVPSGEKVTCPHCQEQFYVEK